MSQIHPEIKSDDYHRPSGLLSRSLQTFNKTKLFLLQLSFIVTYFDTTRVYSLKDSPSALTLILLYFSKIYSILCFITCLYLICKRQSYIKFITYFDEQIAVYVKNDHIRKFIGKNRTIAKLYYPLFTLIFIVRATIRIYYHESSHGQLALEVCRSIFRAFIFLDRLVLIHFIVESCLHVQICLKMVLDQIESLKEVDGLLRIEELQKIRQLYDIAAKKTRKLDSLFFLILSVYYLGSLGLFEMHFMGIIYNYDPLHLMLIFYHALTLIFVTFHVASINRLANAAFNRVYSISYKAHSMEIINEIRYFLIRIGRNDIGLTLLKIVLITPAFVTSIATISLTIALAIPSTFNKTQ